MSKGRWNVPGYKVRHSRNSSVQQDQTNTHHRRSSATFPSCRGDKSSGSCCCAIVSFVHNRTVFLFAFHLPSLLRHHISPMPSWRTVTTECKCKTKRQTNMPLHMSNAHENAFRNLLPIYTSHGRNLPSLCLVRYWNQLASELQYLRAEIETHTPTP